MSAQTKLCGACDGRGWVPHDDVPAAICAACDGFGYPDPQRPPHVYTDGLLVFCDVCCARDIQTNAATFIRDHVHAQEADAAAPEQP